MQAKKLSAILAAAGTFLFILNPDAVYTGAISGMEICLKTVIPSLFPFFILSSILTQSVQGKPSRWLRPIGRLCGVPEGAEYIILLGICGGYPVGAKALSELYFQNKISKADANRMLSFCSNAGPSFIFGIAASIFPSKSIPWMLWCIQILSMLVTAAFLPGKSVEKCYVHNTKKINTMEQALKAMAVVCGWIIFIRVILCLVSQFMIIPIPQILQLILTGIVELSNGCIALSGCADMVVRYVLMGQLLTFGGICVILQTKSLIGDLKLRHYISGKLLQTLLSSALLYLSVPIVFPGNSCLTEGFLCILSCCVVIFLLRHKNNAGNYSLHTV